MTDPTARPAPEAAAEPEPDAGAIPPPPTSDINEANKVAELVEALARESAEYKDKHLRTLAEMENLRRRTEREIAERVLRPALVAVAKGGPKPEAASHRANDNADAPAQKPHDAR